MSFSVPEQELILEGLSRKTY